MKPYPVEFRKKIIEVYEHEKISVRKLAQRFRVAPSFIQKLLKQYKETGDIRPRKQGGSPPPKIQAEHLIDLMEIIEANSDATLEELCDLLAQKVQVRVSRATMGRVTQKLNYSFKKKHFMRRKKPQKKFKNTE